MFKFKFMYVLLSISFFNIIGCKKKTDDDANKDADVKYGMKGSDEVSFFGRFLYSYYKNLMHLSPGDNILVCGGDYYSYKELGTKALKEWLIASGRKGLNVITSSNCNDQATAKVEMIRDQNDYCLKTMTGFHLQSSNGLQHKIHVCDSALMTGKLSQIIFHEMGHLLGLCDQYSANPYNANNPDHMGFYTNCKSKIKSENAKKSVMNSTSKNSPDELVEDDLLASKINACRGAVPTNRVWIKQTKVLDTWENDVAFIEELKRLKNLKLDIIPECLEILNS